MKILAINLNTKKVKTYKSARAVSRALSGVGTDTLHSTISNRCNSGGGYVKNTWVQYTNISY